MEGNTKVVGCRQVVIVIIEVTDIFRLEIGVGWLVFTVAEAFNMNSVYEIMNAYAVAVLARRRAQS